MKNGHRRMRAYGEAEHGRAAMYRAMRDPG